MTRSQALRTGLVSMMLIWGVVASHASEPDELLLGSGAAIDKLIGTSSAEPATGSADLSIVLGMLGGHPLDIRASYIASPPAHARVDVSGSLGRFRLFTSPDTRVVEATDDRRYVLDTRQPGESWSLPEPTSATDGPVTGVVRAMLAEASTRLLAEDKPLDGRQVDVIELVPAVPDEPGQDWGRMLVSVDRVTRLPLKVEQFDTNGRVVMACTMGLGDSGRPMSISMRGSADGQEATMSSRFGLDSQGRLEKANVDVSAPGFGSMKATVSVSHGDKVEASVFEYTVDEGMSAATREELNSLIMGRLVGVALMAAPMGIQ